FEPGLQVGSLHPERHRLLPCGNLQMFSGLDLEPDFPALGLSVGIVRKEQEVDAVVPLDALKGEPTEQDLALDMADAEVGDDVLRRPPLLRGQSLLPGQRHPPPSALPRRPTRAVILAYPGPAVQLSRGGSVPGTQA